MTTPPNQLAHARDMKTMYKISSIVIFYPAILEIWFHGSDKIPQGSFWANSYQLATFAVLLVGGCTILNMAFCNKD